MSIENNRLINSACIDPRYAEISNDSRALSSEAIQSLFSTVPIFDIRKSKSFSFDKNPYEYSPLKSKVSKETDFILEREIEKSLNATLQLLWEKRNRMIYGDLGAVLD